jgi:hypothetical protein
MGKVTLKSNADEALSDDFFLKSKAKVLSDYIFLSNTDEALNAGKKSKRQSNEAFNTSEQ